MKIGEFIQSNMEKAHITQAELARRSGVPASTISSIIIRNNDRISIDMMLKICDVLGCDIEEYVNSIKKDQAKQMPDLFAKKYYSLDDFGRNTVNVVLDSEYDRCTAEPVSQSQPTLKITCSELSASAGSGIWLEDDSFTTIEINDTPLNRQADFVIPVRGDSMLPDFKDGDLALISRNGEVQIGDVGIFIVNGTGYIKERGETELISQNPDYPNIAINENDYVRCVGKVLGKVEI